MSLVVYTTCRIRFRSNGKSAYEREYSDRTLLELRQYDFNDYSLRALDMENKKAEIFNFPLKTRGPYKFGSSAVDPDEIRPNNGTYRLWLNVTTRDQFHEALRAVLEMLNSTDEGSPQPTKSPDVDTKQRERAPSNRPTQSAISRDRNYILVNVHRLNEYIEQGDADKAAKLVTQLTMQGIPFQAKISERLPKEEMFPIRVKINSNNSRTKDVDEQVSINVYKSTTIRELQATFEYTHKIPSSTQHFLLMDF